MITRFAPSPTGLLHLGHAYSAFVIQSFVTAHDGTYLLRIEDTDRTRCRPEFEAAIYDDLAWLGVKWTPPARRQSDHFDVYWQALNRLTDLLYPCSCSRKDIAAAGALRGADGLVYPGTCRARPLSDAKPGDALRLDLGRALRNVSLRTYHDTGRDLSVDRDNLLTQIGDPVLKRKGSGDPAYHLAVVVDDALQHVSHVIRGADLVGMTPLHVLLQSCLDLPSPTYHHHALISDDDGKRLAKIDGSRALSAYRQAGATIDDIKKMVGL